MDRDYNNKNLVGINMDREEIFKYWKDTSDKEYITMNNLFV
jgi:hypothetical protein